MSNLGRRPLVLGSALYAALLAGCGGGVGDGTVADDTGTPSGPAAVPPTASPDTVAPAQLSINTVDAQPIVSRDNYLSAAMTMTTSSGALLFSDLTDIRGRGHSTWDVMPKKPYRLQLASSASLLDMPTKKSWVLLANYADKTLMRNDLAFELSRQMGMPWTPRSHYVELTLNGAQQGSYQLAERVRVSPDRVNIPKMKVGDNTGSALTGGYLIEVDFRYGEDFWLESQWQNNLKAANLSFSGNTIIGSTMTDGSSDLPSSLNDPWWKTVFCVCSPSKLLNPGWENQRAYITQYIANTENALYGTNFKDPDTGYAAWIDVDSAVDMYLLNEIVKNVDFMRASTYMYKQRDGKLIFGPAWDFDLAFGNTDYMPGGDGPEGWYARQSPWFARMFQDPAFAAKVKARWTALKSAGTLDHLTTYADTRAAYLQDTQARNFAQWNILGSYVWPNRVVTGSYAGELAAMKSWLSDRLQWMDTQFNL